MAPSSRKGRVDNERARRLGASGVRWAAVVVSVVVGIALVGAGVWKLTQETRVLNDRPASAVPVASTESGRETVEPLEDPVASSTVEVPSVVGDSLQDAELVLGAAGFGVQLVATGNTTEAAEAQVVFGQQPAPGDRVAEGATIVLSVRSAEAHSLGATSSQRVNAFVVCIDPGHQAHGDPSPEPIGPGATKTKASVTGGATGVETRIPEYELALQISMNLKSQLESRGVKVVMTRTTNDVNISNSQRAALANKVKADLLVRVHADGSPDRGTAGISTLYPAVNRWTKPIASASKRAALIVQSQVVAATGAMDRGIVARSDLSGFNYATVPAVLIECGFVSNPIEDRLLSSPHYQDKLAMSIADGVLTFLGKEEQ